MPRHFPAGKRVKPAPAGNPQRAGFTLVELLIGASLSAAIMAAVLSSYIYMGRNLTRLGNQQILETEARRTLGYFAQDVQAAMSVSVATGLTAPSFQVTFLVISGGGSTRQIIYFYNSTGSPITRSISGNNVTIPANSLIRIVSTGSAIIPPIQTLLRNIVSTSDGCYIRFFDSSGNASDNGNAPYTPVMTYPIGIKQAALAFSTQLGNASNGTRTLTYQVATGRLVLRNKTFLP